jgi:hypothetical protein
MARGASSLGRPRRGEKPRHKGAKDTPPGHERVSIIHLKGSLDYYNHMKEVADKSGLPFTTQFRVAYREWCQKNGYGTPPAL